MPRHRILLLVGPSLANRNTVATFLESGLDVVGVCVADKNRRYGFNTSFLSRKLKEQGWLRTTSQVEARVLYNLLNRRRDAEIQAELFDRERIDRVVAGYSGPRLEVEDYNRPEVLEWARAQSPDFIVIHTPYWVGKHLRALVHHNVIGGHPGMTPHYRGTHSSFWAAYNGEFDHLGYTVFFVDAGVDTGDVIHQARLDPSPGDSFVTHGWRCMAEIAQRQVAALCDLDGGMPLPRRPVGEPPPGSNYPHPTLSQYVSYRRRQRLLR